MRFLLSLVLLSSLPVFAGEKLNFLVDREGESFYSTKKHERAISKVLRKVDIKKLEGAFDSANKNLTRICSYDFNQSLRDEISKITTHDLDFKGAIYALRKANKFDDVVAMILLTANEVMTTQIRPNETDFSEIKITPNESEALKVISSFENRFLKNTCLDEAYGNLYQEIQKIDKRIKSNDLSALYQIAFDERRITPEIYEMLEKARLNKVETQSIGLKAYITKMKSLRLQYPITNNEKSEYVTSKVKKMHMSRRQRLLTNYSDIQIFMMGNIIKTLRRRIESPKIEILIYDKGEEVSHDILQLDKMERYRFALKELRKEIENLKLNTYFNGFAPDYLDLVTASYEIGLVAGSELDTIANYQEVWNPKKTFWDKAGIWLQTFSSVATIAVPPPYGFIPALALVIIQATTGKDDKDSDKPGNLF